MQRELPTGTVTFLFTDIEGSTRLWQEHPTTMPEVLARHDVLVRDVIEGRGGDLFKHTGDGACAAFTDATAALDAATIRRCRDEARTTDLDRALTEELARHPTPT